MLAEFATEIFCYSVIIMLFSFFFAMNIIYYAFTGQYYTFIFFYYTVFSVFAHVKLSCTKTTLMTPDFSADEKQK